MNECLPHDQRKPPIIEEAMSCFPLSFAIVLALCCKSSSRTEDKRPPVEELRVRLSEIQKDMTADDVRKSLGKPDRIGRVILFRRHLEQWAFDDLNVRIEFNCFPGAEPRVLNVHQGIAPLKP
jgi:hypothetical protein